MSRPFRVLPRVGEDNAHFWRGGADGKLQVMACSACGHLLHPPAPLCPECLSDQLEVRALSGRGTVYSFTVNHQPWMPGFKPPYIVAIVELDEQPGLRLTTNLVDVAPEDAAIGARVSVRFEEHEDGIFVPVFGPDVAEGA